MAVVPVSLETHQPTVNKFEIASHLSPTACVSHHAALEFYGYANQVFYDTTFTSQSKVKPFDLDGVSYRQIFSGISEGVSEQNGVRETDLERSVLDCIDAFIYNSRNFTEPLNSLSSKSRCYIYNSRNFTELCSAVRLYRLCATRF